MVRKTLRLLSRSWANVPHDGYSGGIGLFLIQPPHGELVKVVTGLASPVEIVKREAPERIGCDRGGQVRAERKNCTENEKRAEAEQKPELVHNDSLPVRSFAEQQASIKTAQRSVTKEVRSWGLGETALLVHILSCQSGVMRDAYPTRAARNSMDLLPGRQ